MTDNPYSSMPPRAFWRAAVAEVSPLEIRDLYRPKFSITRLMSIAAAGSCFAQHIARQFRTRGYKFLQMEPPPPNLDAEQLEKFGFELYSARYGNIYSIRQLLQLFRRAAGSWVSCEDVWETDGRYYDPFRPSIEPSGFVSAEEMRRDRCYHLERVKRLLRRTELFVFTFGLTEAWLCREDGTVLPTCPGTIAGTFDPARYEFHNFDYKEVLQDAENFIALALDNNPEMRFLFTVSPVPLTATATQSHVLQASVYSKSVLRAVCGALYERYAQVDYFPSYELVASHPMRAMFFQPNLRGVSPVGVEHVMKTFFRAHETEDDIGQAVERRIRRKRPGVAVPATENDNGRRRRRRRATVPDPLSHPDDVICDEEVLENSAP